MKKPIFNEYHQKIIAVKWSGSDSLLDDLKNELHSFVNIWKVNGTNPPSQNSLRISNIQYQGDYWVNIGDYIVIDEMPESLKKVRVISKETFDENYKICL